MWTGLLKKYPGLFRDPGRQRERFIALTDGTDWFIVMDNQDFAPG